jgi:WNK lysine deficient protein kinase
VRPAGLQKVASPQLAEFINLCISPRDARPRARQLLKHSFFDSIRRDKMLVSSRSDAALAAAGGGVGSGMGGDGGSDYGGSMTSGGPVSRTASSLNDLMAAVVVSSGPLSDRWERERGGALLQQHVAQHTAQQLAAAGAANIAAALQGLPSASSSAALLGGGASGGSHPLSRTVSAEAVHSDRAHSDRAHSDSASVRSQRSNASELALAHMLEDIAEGEGEGDTTGGWARRRAGRGQESSSMAATCLEPAAGVSKLPGLVSNLSAHLCLPCRQWGGRCGSSRRRRRRGQPRGGLPPGLPPGLPTGLPPAPPSQPRQARQPHQQRRLPL